jgi:hypothetical protein
MAEIKAAKEEVEGGKKKVISRIQAIHSPSSHWA